MNQQLEPIIKPDGTACSQAEADFLRLIARFLIDMIIPDYEHEV